MATEADVRRIALALPGAAEERGARLAFSVKNKGKDKGFAWSWLERIHPKKARIENRSVLAVRVADAEEKALLLSIDEEKIFTEPHYNGYPAVLVRLPNVDVSELEKLVVEAWRCMAPRSVVDAYDAAPAAAKAATTSKTKPATKAATTSKTKAASTSKAKAATKATKPSKSKKTSSS